MAVTTLTCAFVTFCALDGTCEDNPMQLALVYEEDVPFGEITLGPDGTPYPVSVTRPTFGVAIGGDVLHAFGGGGLFMPVMLSYFGTSGEAMVSFHMVPGTQHAVMSSTGHCRAHEGRLQ